MVLQADHPLYVGSRGLMCGQTDLDGTLRQLLAALCWEVARHLSLRGQKSCCQTKLIYEKTQKN